MTVVGISGTQYQLDSKMLSDGGEGSIYRVLGGFPKKVAKIYKEGVPTRDLEEKLIVMVNRPPSTKVLSQVAWPLDVVYDVNKQFCGFVMPELNINAELGDVYQYPSKINISSSQKVIIAENICAVISEVHKAGYVFGDFNPRNIGVDINTGSVAFLDTDSYHIVIDKAQNRAYRCNVCAPGYSAPELLEKCAAHASSHPSDNKQAYAKTPLDTFTQETDNFALAIHIFKLLMNGYTPYGGIKDAESRSQASPGTGDAAVRRDQYCFKPGYKHMSVAIPALVSFPQEISDLFTRAFMFGKLDPKQRPSAVEWHNALEQYEKTLITCKKNPLHQYDGKNSSCPYCDADQRYESATTPSIPQKQYRSNIQPPVQPVVSPPVQRITNQPPLQQIPSPPGKKKQPSHRKTKRISTKTKSLLIFAFLILVLSSVYFVFIPMYQHRTIPLSKIVSAQPGNIVELGSYEQDGDLENGTEPIRWIVVQNTGSRLLLLSESILDVQPFNTSPIDSTWATSRIRSWLNNTFYGNAFSNNDRDYILQVEIQNVDYIKAESFEENGRLHYVEYGGKSRNGKYKPMTRATTSDYVFLLSYDEAQSIPSLSPKITEYAKYSGPFYLKNRDWILRSTIRYDRNMMNVEDDGYRAVFAVKRDWLNRWHVDFQDTFTGVDNDSVGVRPAIWIKTN